MDIENSYETDRALNEYLLFHYGEPAEILPYTFGPHDALNFHARCVELLLEQSRGKSCSQALDIGCAVGRATFELARHCDRVLGIDYSVRFIEKANELKCYGETDYDYVCEGRLTEKANARVPDGVDRRRVQFIHGDACDLPTALGGFELVHAANLIDRLPEPIAYLKFLPHLVKTGGVAMITSPYTWTEEYTPEKKWLGGFLRDNKPVKSIETLRKHLESDFTMLECVDIPFIIREHARKFQWGVSQATIWRRH